MTQEDTLFQARGVVLHQFLVGTLDYIRIWRGDKGIEGLLHHIDELVPPDGEHRSDNVSS